MKGNWIYGTVEITVEAPKNRTVTDPILKENSEMMKVQTCLQTNRKIYISFFILKEPLGI